MGGTREHIQPLSKPSLLAPKLEKLSRLVLGNKRMDDYINYKKNSSRNDSMARRKARPVEAP